MNELITNAASAKREVPASVSAPNKFISAIFNSRLPKGLKVKEYAWENEYRGTDAAFIESGLIKPGWIPGHPGNPKGKVMVGLVNGEMAVLPAGPFPKNDQFDNGFINIRRSSKGRLIVSVYCSTEEREKREEIEYQESKKERVEAARKEIDKSLGELPSSPDDYIRKELHIIRSLAHMVRNSLVGGFGYSGGYVFPRELVDEFDIALDRSIQMINDAQINFDEEKKQKEIAAIKRVLEKYRGLTDTDIEP